LSTVTGHRIGRAWLAVTHGSSARLFVHDIGEAPPSRSERLRAAQRGGSWTFLQRGHAPSSHCVGGVYRISEFALDLLRLLRDVVPTPVLISADGASGLVAALAAAVEPELVGGLCLLPARGNGWGSRPEALVGPASEPNPGWFSAIQLRTSVRPGEDDPMLRYGPPETMPMAAVAAALSRVSRPWSAPDGHLLEPWLPGGLRVPHGAATA
jgi:pimeloyl-ACP methyl ester carboxylesterase